MRSNLDWPDSGAPRSARMSDRTAVVLGASIAGLCAARALAAHVDRVVVVERDALPEGIADRGGVPQGRHVHQLLIRGRQQLESLFPGFEADMARGGAIDVDFLRDFATLRPTGWWRPVSSGFRTIAASRTLIESVIRTRLRTHGNVVFRERSDVRGLVLDIPPRRVRAVTLVPRDGGPAEDLPATLVVDACGRASRAPEWFRALGLPAPDESVVDAHTGYATRWYRAPSRRPSEWWWKGVWIDPVDLDHDLAGVLSPVEGDRWIATIGGAASLLPETDPAGFQAAMRRLRSPLIADVLAQAEPLSPVYGTRETANRFRHYERWPVRLAGFIAIGDAACKFNPVYGQGMTTAALSADLLGRLAGEMAVQHRDLPERFFRAQARLARAPWSMATGADFRFPGTTGQRPPLLGLTTRYMDALFAATGDDETLRRTLGTVIHMLRPPRDLFAPTTVLRVLRATVRGPLPSPTYDEITSAHAQLAA